MRKQKTTSRRTSVGPVQSQASHVAILEAAEAILKESDSTAGFSMEAVAKRARAGKPTLYRRWKNKGELFLELVATRIMPGLPTVDDIPETGCLSEELADYLEKCWAKLTQPNAAIARAFLRELDADLQKQMQATILGQRRHQFEALMQRGAARGEIRSGYDLAAAWDLYIGFNIGRLTLDQRPDKSELRRAADAIVDGARRADRSAASPPGTPSAAAREIVASIVRTAAPGAARARTRKSVIPA